MFRSLMTAALVLAMPMLAGAQTTSASPSAMMHHTAMKSSMAKHGAMKGSAMHGSMKSSMHGSMKGAMHDGAMKASPKP